MCLIDMNNKREICGHNLEQWSSIYK